MTLGQYDVARGLASLRAAVLEALEVALVPQPRLALAGAGGSILFTEAADLTIPIGDPVGGPDGFNDAEFAASSEECEMERERLIALVELARTGDKEAFGLLYDHYNTSVFRFLYYRTRSTSLAEDLTSETFFRALRSMNNFRWQGKDFGAWLMTIARNLATDHF